MNRFGGYSQSLMTSAMSGLRGHRSYYSRREQVTPFFLPHRLSSNLSTKHRVITVMEGA